MSDQNPKAMTQAELLKYLEEDFMPSLLPKLANIKNLEPENARLKAEVERLESRDVVRTTAIAGLHQTIRERDADVERLRKAGDALQKRLYVLENPTHPEVYLKLLSAWNAAKEGKPSV